MDIDSEKIADYLNKSLSNEQLKVFEGDFRYKCIFASAGSGKTRTLVHLIINDLAKGVPSEKIIAFTFTEKAASDILNRVHRIATEDFPGLKFEGLSIGTIHSWCYQYLLTKSNYYNFSVIDELQTKALVTRLYDLLKLGEVYRTTFPKGVNEFLVDIDVFLNERLPESQVPENLRLPFKTFFDVLAANRLFTFGTVVDNAIKSLLIDESFDPNAVYVDEYQDVNPAQVDLIKAMTKAAARLTVIGDDLQCIYNWRGSDVKRIVEFEADFTPAKTFRLNTNYRSRPAIVKLGNDIAESIQLRDRGKVMNPDKEPVGDVDRTWITLPDETEELQAIVSIIQNAISSGVPAARIAILLRSVRSAGREIYDALVAAGIPVECPVFSDAEKFIVDFLIPLFEWLEINREPSNEEEEHDIQLKAKELLSEATRWSVGPIDEEKFWASMEAWKKQLSDNSSESYNIRRLLYEFLNAVQIVVGTTSSDLMVGLGIGSQIIRAVEEIHRRRLKEQPRRRTLALIKEVRIALQENYADFGESIPVEIRGTGVLITTVHQSKGLEWPVVILPRLLRHRFPVKKSRHRSTFSDAIIARYGTTIEDEKRLFYVACTRAEERLFLLDDSKDGLTARSIFLTDYISAKGILPSLPASIPAITASVPAPRGSIQQEALRIGLSDVLVYLECPLQFGLRKKVGIQPAIQDNLGYGKGLHEMIQRRFDAGGDWTEEEISDNVRSNVFLPYTSVTQEVTSQGAISRMIKQLQVLKVFTGEVKSEEKVELYLPEGIIEGVIDNIEIEGNTLVIRDWKANIHEEFLDRYKRQLLFYQYALQLRTGKTIRLEIVDVKKSADTSTIQRIVINQDRVALDAFINDLRQALKGIQLNSFSPTKDIRACQSCDLKLICKHNLDLDATTE